MLYFNSLNMFSFIYLTIFIKTYLKFLVSTNFVLPQEYFHSPPLPPPVYVACFFASLNVPYFFCKLD